MSNTDTIKVEQLPGLLEDDDFVQVSAIDVDGLLRGKLISKDKFLSLFHKKTGSNGEFAYCAALFGWDMHDKFYSSEYSNRKTGFGDALAKIDLQSFRRIPWERNLPFFLINILNPHTHQPLPVCPRSLLQRVADKAGSMGFKAMVGVEYEFVAFRLPNRPDESAGRHTAQSYLKEFAPATLPTVYDGSNAYNLIKHMHHGEFYSTILENCKEFNVPIESFHAESGPGMYEAAVSYSDIVDLADKAALFKHVVKATAASIGDLQPTFMAKPRTGLQGMSGHTHISLVDIKTGDNMFHRHEEDKSAPYKDMAWLSDTGRSFLAGILQALPDIMPVLAPNINSYKRLVENHAAPVTVSWAYESRLGSIRVITAPTTSPKGARLEIRVPGADSTSHLVFAALVSAGLRGVEQKLDLLSAEGCPPPLSELMKSADENTPIPGVRLPQTLAEATERFKKSEMASELLGADFVRHFALTREEELKLWNEAVTDWEFARYIEHA